MNIIKFYKKVRSAFRLIGQASDAHSEELKLMIGALHARGINTIENVDSIYEAEFKVFSQWGDDGIIQWLIRKIDPTIKTFIEFGVENYQESNTKFLLINNGWKGLIMDGSESNINYVKAQDYYWKYDLEARCHFITRDNINLLIKSAGIIGEIGLLHIDLDGNDYWIWEKLNIVNPIIVIVEYNSILGADRAITIPYIESFQRTTHHHSNLYYGASLPALCHLADVKGYTLVGTNSAGNNAYFVRNDKLRTGIPTPTCSKAYVCSQFREARDTNGNLTFTSGCEREKLIRGLPVWNVLSNTEETF